MTSRELPETRLRRKISALGRGIFISFAMAGALLASGPSAFVRAQAPRAEEPAKTKVAAKAQVVLPNPPVEPPLAPLRNLPAVRIDQPEEPDENAPAQPLFALSDAHFDYLAFGPGMTSAKVPTVLDSWLTTQIAEIDSTCTLTEAQKNKLRLAGRGDIKRYLDRVEEKRALLKGLRIERNKLNEIYGQIQQLQAPFRSGPFGEGSIFSKSIGNTLTAEQSARRDQALQFPYRTRVDRAVAMLSASLVLNFDQRKRLARLLLEETRPPKMFGQNDEYHVILLQMARLQEARVKPIFDDAQWRTLSPALAAWRVREHELRANGYVPGDAAPERDANPARAVP